MAALHFVVFILVSLIVFVAILRVALRRRTQPVNRGKTAAVAFVVVVVGMCFAKWGATHDVSWSLYYGLPAAISVFMPPLAFRMRGRESLEYLLMASVNAPVIHAFFSFFVGWHEYMPFIHIPSLWSLQAGA